MEPNRDSATSRSPATNHAATIGNDLARFCFEPDVAESKRALAWVNSICFVYLMIGFLGLKAYVPMVARKPVTEEAVATVIEPLITAAQTVTPDSNPEETLSERSSEEPGGVAVVVDSPAVAFAVPTVGNVLVPMGMAQAPPANQMQGVAPLSAPRIEQIGVTGIGGSRPPPVYPRESLLNREQGTVVLLIEVDESGKITSVQVKE